MKLFVDEDTGSSIGIALKQVWTDVEWVGNSKHSRIKLGAKDEVWLPFVGTNGMLVLSRNINIVEVETQRDLVVSKKVGIVFFPQHLNKLELLRLILKKWDWLVSIDSIEARPFAFLVSAFGRPTRLPLEGSVSRLSRRRKIASLPSSVPAVKAMAIQPNNSG